MKIKIKKSPDADRRTAQGEVTPNKLEKASIEHIQDVRKGMSFLADMLNEAGACHDWTKTRYLKEFWEDYKQGLTGDEFKKAPWYQIHINKERHHLNSRCPEDVNLLDVLELIVDCVMAGKGRFAKVDMEFFELPDGVLEEAYQNTIKMVNEAVEVED